MPFPGALPIVSSRSQQLYCSRRRKLLSAGECLDAYVTACRERRRLSTCFGCPQGRAVRSSCTLNDRSERPAPPADRRTRTGRLEARG